MSAPSGYTALDFVGFTDKGTYNPLATYMRNDLVHYSGNIWKCLVDNTTGITPVEGANWTLWIGTSANLAERTIAPLLNNPADAAFGVGRQVIYDDWLWEVIAPIAIGDTLIDYAVDPTNANIKKSNPVETQLLAVKAEADATDNMIAPTESNANSSSAAYAVGDQLILNNILYTVTAPVAIGDALVSGTGGNIEASDSLTDQLADKVDSSDLGTAAAKDSTNAVTQNSTDLVESGAVYSSVDALSTALTTYENVCGAKNLLPNNATTKVENGVTFTVNSDGTVTVNGTSTGWISFILFSGTLPKGTYTFSDGGVSVAGSERFEITDANESTIIASCINGANIDFTLNSNTAIKCRIACGTGKTISNKTFYPMVRPVGTDGTYVPYAMTNRELTLAKTMQISGTLEASTGDYVIANALPYGGFIPLAGYYLTSGGQYRPLTIGYSGRGLIILGATSDMASRPYIVMGYNSNY